MKHKILHLDFFQKIYLTKEVDYKIAMQEKQLLVNPQRRNVLDSIKPYFAFLMMIPSSIIGIICLYYGSKLVRLGSMNIFLGFIILLFGIGFGILFICSFPLYFILRRKEKERNGIGENQSVSPQF